MPERDVLAVDFGTSNTYFSKAPGDAENPAAVGVDFGDGRDGLATAILYRRERGPLVGARAIHEFAEATPAERAGYELRAQFKPDLVASDAARRWAVDFLRTVIDTARAARVDVQPEGRQVLFGAPCEAGDEFRRVLKAVAAEAGFGAIETADEPVGALLHHVTRNVLAPREALEGVLVVDFGGGTCDFAWMLRGQVRHSWGDMELGGRLFDDLFFQWFVEQTPGALERMRADNSEYFVHAHVSREAKEWFSRCMAENRGETVQKKFGDYGFLRGMTWAEFERRARAYRPSDTFRAQWTATGVRPAAFGASRDATIDLIDWFRRALVSGLGGAIESAPDGAGVPALGVAGVPALGDAGVPALGGAGVSARTSEHGGSHHQAEHAHAAYRAGMPPAAGSGARDIRRVILAGGSSSWPFVPDIVRAELGVADEAVRRSDRPYAVISEGLAVLPAQRRRFARIRAALERDYPAFRDHELKSLADRRVASAADAIAETVTRELFDERIRPLLDEFRAAGGSVARLRERVGGLAVAYDERIRAVVDEQVALLLAGLPVQVAELTTAWMARRGVTTQSPSLALQPADAQRDWSRPLQLPDVYGGMLNLIGTMVTAAVAAIAAKVCGGAGLALVATGPVGLLIGALIGIAAAGSALWLGRDEARRRAEAWDSPAWMVRPLLTDSKIAGARDEFRDQLRVAVLEQLDPLRGQLEGVVDGWVRAEMQALSEINAL